MEFQRPQVDPTTSSRPTLQYKTCIRKAVVWKQVCLGRNTRSRSAGTAARNKTSWGGGGASNENENERLRSEFGRNVSCASNFGQQVFQKKNWTSLYNSTIHCVSSFWQNLTRLCDGTLGIRLTKTGAILLLSHNVGSTFTVPRSH